MSITRSYNKYTDTYYAYETTYVWDEKAQKNIQKKQCIGKFDPETDEIIPNGKRGRPRGSSADPKKAIASADNEYTNILSEAKKLLEKLKSVESSLEKLSSEVVTMSADFDSLLLKMQSKGQM
ncbi:MAG: hypothetical protein J6W60_03455 [Treponema sp.]|nr:hypothetical protein [Treponema sp.]